jgi:hypothetical protein
MAIAYLRVCECFFDHPQIIELSHLLHDFMISKIHHIVLFINFLIKIIFKQFDLNYP